MPGPSGVEDDVRHRVHIHEDGVVQRRPGVGQLRGHGKLMAVQFDGAFSRHVDAGPSNDLASTERAVDLRSHPRSDDEIGVGVETDDLHLLVAAGGRQRGDVRLHRALGDAIRLGDFGADVVGEIKRARSVPRKQGLRLGLGILRRDHQIGAHTFLHAFQSIAEVHGKQRSPMECEGQHANDDDKRRRAEGFASQIDQRQLR